MEYHNYNTPLDRIDEDFVKQILAGEYEPSCGCERDGERREQRNNGCGCASRTDAVKTCRYNRRYQGHTRGRSGVINMNAGGNSCSVNYNSGYGTGARREDRPCENDSCSNGCNGSTSETVCGCGDCVDFKSPALHGVPHSMVYSPHQDFEGLYECDEALDRGTIFRCLDFPFVPTPCNYRRRNEENKGCR